MNRQIRNRLEQEVKTGAYAYIQNLAAAEVAVQRGQFSIAKILRAMGFAERVQATEAARVLAADQDPSQRFESILSETVNEDLGSTERRTAELDQRRRRVMAGVANLAQRARASLTAHSDVMESDVGQFLWGCYGCGNLVENDCPEACSVCGTRKPEFEVFEPFYSITAEHLGQLAPLQIIAILEAGPDEVAAAIANANDATLSQKPSPRQWNVKEIMAHIMETELLFNRRVDAILSRHGHGIATIETPVPPWKLHEGKGYEKMPAETILDRLRKVRATTLALVQGLTMEQWAWWGTNGGARTTILDLGTWLANHDKGHIEQVRKLCR